MFNDLIKEYIEETFLHYVKVSGEENLTLEPIEDIPFYRALTNIAKSVLEHTSEKVGFKETILYHWFITKIMGETFKSIFEFPEYRLGQAIFNICNEDFPKETYKVMQTVDCFYDDDNCAKFLEYVYEEIKPTMLEG